MRTDNKVLDRLESVQFLRALAAIAVVTHHIPFFGNGAWGVDLFFVISGFIMCFVTAQGRENFLIKRAIRVIPLYWLGTLGVFCVALLLPEALNNTKASFSQLLMSFAFIPFQKGNEVHPILFLGWTLNYEMFFYVLFAISMMLSHRYRSLICSTMLVCIVLFGWLADCTAVPVKFYTSSILLEFVFGMICFELYRRYGAQGTPRGASNRRVCLGLVGLTLIGCMPLMTPLVPDIGRVLAWGVLAASAFLLIIVGFSAWRIPAIAVLLGDASYSLYLFHPYVIQGFDKIGHAFAVPDFRGYAFALMAVALCCGLSVLVYRQLELPMTNKLRAILIPAR